MAWIWTGMVVVAVLCGIWTGQEAAVAAAAAAGAQGAVELCISLAGMMCLWTGVMEIMRRSGLAEKLSRLLRPVLGLIFPQVARDRLGAFLFQGEDVFKQVGNLSGGEQSRLRLCMLMDEKINLLVLDEPTNHLDIQSREWIEEAVEEYEGNLLFVSHDRYFIDRFASRIWLLENGQITDFRGTYQEFQAARARGAAGQAVSDAVPAPEKAAEPERKKEKPKRPGGTKNLEKEVTAAERAVAKAEEAMDALALQIEEASADYLKLQELYEQREAMEAELQGLYDRWEALSAQLEEARG